MYAALLYKHPYDSLLPNTRLHMSCTALYTMLSKQQFQLLLCVQTSIQCSLRASIHISVQPSRRISLHNSINNIDVDFGKKFYTAEY